MNSPLEGSQHSEKAFIISSVLKRHALKAHNVIEYKEPARGKNRPVKLNEFVKKRKIQICYK